MAKSPPKFRTKITPELHAQILKMYRSGEKGDYIAATMGISSSAVFRIAKEAGLARGKGRRTSPGV